MQALFAVRDKLSAMSESNRVGSEGEQHFMAWNEPGSDKPNPWGQGQGQGQGNGNGQGGGQRSPPDLDQVMRDLQQKFGAIFGGRGGGSGGGGGSGWGASKMGAAGLGFIVVLVVLGWLATGIYVVEQGEQAV